MERGSAQLGCDGHAADGDRRCGPVAWHEDRNAGYRLEGTPLNQRARKLERRSGIIPGLVDGTRERTLHLPEEDVDSRAGICAMG